MKTEVTKKSLIAIRNVELGDKEFILATWLRGIRYGNRDFFKPAEEGKPEAAPCDNCRRNVDWFKSMHDEDFYHHYTEAILKFLSRPTCVVKIACLKNDPDVLLGYIVFDQYEGSSVLHYIHVKEAWRNIGLARDLIPNDATAFTQLTRSGRGVWLSKYRHLKFNPFL